MKKTQSFVAAFSAAACWRWFVFIWLSTLAPQPSTVLAQGSLTPPGPPGPTLKTLQQIEPRTPISSLPFTINNPGSYYVTTNLTGLVFNDGITISANFVTLDLGGFTLSGPAGGTFEYGITTSGSVSNIVICNGSIVRWSRSGIFGSTIYNGRVEHLIAADNQLNGIRLGDNAAVEHCAARRNGVSASGQNGIYVGAGSIVSDCVVSGQDGATSTGIKTDGRCVIQHCAVTANNGVNGAGMDAGAYCLISDCVVQYNRGASNTLGINISSGQVKHCVVNNNSGDGIVAGNNAYILENELLWNDGNGINLTGNAARVDSNHLSNNGGYGIKAGVTNGSNLIIRNSVGNDSNGVGAYKIAPGNKDANLLFIGSGFSSTDPWGNFSF
jgi:hypothetical protein